MAELSKRLRAFLSRYVHSVSALEVLLLLHAQPSRDWTAADMAAQLRGDAAATAEHLRFFLAEGMVIEPAPDLFRYAPADPDIHDLTLELKQAYAERHVTVIELIYSEPHRALRAFADAFKLKKD